MYNLTEHVMINKWDDDINEAITFVGGNTYGSEGLPEYANIIRTQLIANKSIGNGVYQDFLYVDKNNKSSLYPWEGAPTDSTNAIQAKAVAESIKKLYDTMALTERYKLLLVDEIPNSSVDLSAVYLIKKCNCDCDCDHHSNIYYGCYFIKNGDNIQRVDIQEFVINFDQLFYVTRGEYVDLTNHTDIIEETLRKKFGKYWEDEDFSMENLLLPIVDEVMSQISSKIDEIAAEVGEKFQEKFDEKFEEKFEGFSQYYIRRDELIELNQEILDLK